VLPEICGRLPPIPFEFHSAKLTTMFRVRLTDLRFSGAVPSRASGRAARPVPRLTIAEARANCTGHDA
jgi:hypothetical protein